MPTQQSLDHEAYEAEVVATVWREKSYTESRSRPIVAVTLEGRWPATKLIVTWDFAGDLRSGDFLLYYTDPWRQGQAFSSATDRAIGIIDAVSES